MSPGIPEPQQLPPLTLETQVTRELYSSETKKNGFSIESKHLVSLESKVDVTNFETSKHGQSMADH
jgi:hypothetical protein